MALSAGKAHRNHKHHHVHKFDSFGEISTTTTPAPPIVKFHLVASSFNCFLDFCHFFTIYLFIRKFSYFPFVARKSEIDLLFFILLLILIIRL